MAKLPKNKNNKTTVNSNSFTDTNLGAPRIHQDIIEDLKTKEFQGKTALNVINR